MKAWGFKVVCPYCEEEQPKLNNYRRKPNENSVCIFCRKPLGVSQVRKSRAGQPRNSQHTHIPTNGNDPLVVRGEDFRRVIQPLLDARNKAKEDGYVTTSGFGWLAQQLGEDEKKYSSRAKAILYRTEWVSFRIAEEWTWKLGLYNVFRDGTLKIYANPRMSRETWENYFIRCGDEIPTDVHFVD